MSTFLNKLVFLTLTSGIFMVSQSATAQIVIDGFTTDQALIFAVGAGANSSSFVNTAGTDIIGGERDLQVGVIAGAVSSGEVTGGGFSFSVAAGSTGDSHLIYDGPDNLPDVVDLDPLGLGGVDLTAGGSLNSILFQISSQDQPSTVVIEVYTDAANISSFTTAIPVITTTTNFVVPFTDFTTAAGVGADFSNVGAISMVTTGVTVDTRYTFLVADAALDANMTDALLIDNDFDANLSPGDTLRYTTTITNTDDGLDAGISGVTFNSAPDANTSLVVGSVATSQGTVTTGNTAGDTTVSIDIGTLTDGSTVTLTYDVVLDSPLTTAINQVSAQGVVTANGLTGLLTDDTAVIGGPDPTVTPITQTVIGDFVWNDLNGDGIQDGGAETGIQGVTIDAYFDINNSNTVDGGDLLLGTATTGVNGDYRLGLPNFVEFVLDVTDTGNVLSGLTLSGGSDPVATTVSGGGADLNIDFGYQPQNATIGDFVWNDLDGDGVQDGGEPGLSGVTVYLDLNSNGALDGGEPSDTTDASGAYDFTALATGSYQVDIDSATVTAGFTNTTGNLPMTVNLAAGEDYNDADFGFQQQDATIGDFVWNDLDGDGVQDGGEAGLPGVTVYLDQNNNGTLDGGETSTATDGSGAYDFTGLPAGSYTVEIDASSLAAGLTFTTGNLPLTVNLAAGEDFNDADFGYQQQDASIGDFIWSDFNGDGIQDGGEPGLGGVTVYLDQNNNGILDGGETTTATNGAGAYDFTALTADTYTVAVVASSLPAGYTLTTSNLPLTVNLTAGEDFNDADFGYQPPLVDVSVNDNTVIEVDAGNNSVDLTITLSAASPQTVTVDYATQDVSALAGSDYLATSGTLTFAPGVVSEVVTIDIIGDALDESDESFELILSNPNNANLADATGSVLIQDNDSGADLSVALTINPMSATVGEVISYTMTIDNAGPDNALSVESVLDLTGSAAFIDATPSQGSCAHAGGMVTCTLGDINMGTTVTVVVNATLQTNVGTVGQASVSSPLTSDPVNNNNQAVVALALGTGPVQVPTLSWLGYLLLTCAVAGMVLRRPRKLRSQ